MFISISQYATILNSIINSFNAQHTIKTLKNAEQNTQKNLVLTSNLLNLSPQPILCANICGCVTYKNQVATELLLPIESSNETISNILPNIQKINLAQCIHQNEDHAIE